MVVSSSSSTQKKLERVLKRKKLIRNSPKSDLCAVNIDDCHLTDIVKNLP